MRANVAADKRLDTRSTARHCLVYGVLLVYRHAFSPILHAAQRALTGSAGACRFQPSCSEYAALALSIHGPRHGGMLSLKRILRCHPFCRGGFDPVPSASVSEMQVAVSSCVQPGKGARHLPW